MAGKNRPGWVRQNQQSFFHVLNHVNNVNCHSNLNEQHLMVLKVLHKKSYLVF